MPEMCVRGRGGGRVCFDKEAQDRDIEKGFYYHSGMFTHLASLFDLAQIMGIFLALMPNDVWLKFVGFKISTLLFLQGCAQKLEDNLEPVVIAIGVIAIIFAAVEVPCTSFVPNCVPISH